MYFFICGYSIKTPASISPFKVTCLGSVNPPALAGHCHPRMFLAGILRQIARYALKKIPDKSTREKWCRDAPLTETRDAMTQEGFSLNDRLSAVF